MLPEILEALSPAPGETYVDGTFGAGGYTRALLDAAPCRVIAIDRDAEARERAKDFESAYGSRFVFLRGCFGDVEHLLAGAGLEKIDGFVLDLGVSSMQIDQAGRGFSFRFDGPLDMRMDREAPETAADIVNQYREKDLADLIYKYGEERLSRRIARRIVERRTQGPINTTEELANLVRAAIPKSPRDQIDPATRTFQALRIAVNDELGELERALDASTRILNPGGRLVVVSFHSLEDAIVKGFMRREAGTAPRTSRHAPDLGVSSAPRLDIITRKALRPSERENSENPRSRSARLRAAVRRAA